VGGEKGFYDYDNLYALNASTGDIVWHAPYAGSSPALSDGMLFSIGDDQKVYAFKDSSISPVANFTANVTSGISPLTVKFDASTSQNAASYSWDFGDGSTGTGQIIEHTFNGAGTYNVVLNATNSNGIVSSDAKAITVTSAQGPALIITTTADPTTYSAAGQKIKYTYVVTNTGTVPIRSVSVTDNKNDVKISSATLAPGSSITGKGTYTVKQSDINAGSVSNSAAATGRYNGKKVTSNTVTTTVTSTFVPSPALTITKTPHQKTYNRVGRVITYTYIVKNTGNVPISGIKVTDNKTKVSLKSSRTLSPGSSVEGESNYVIKKADITAGLVINSAYATGTYNGQAVNSNTVTATVKYKK
jgi:PKD repeat protein